MKSPANLLGGRLGQRGGSGSSERRAGAWAGGPALPADCSFHCFSSSKRAEFPPPYLITIKSCDWRRGPVCKLHVSSHSWLVLALCLIPVVLTEHPMKYVSGVLGPLVENILVLFKDLNHTHCVRNSCTKACEK